MRVPLLDLHHQHAALGDDLDRAIRGVFDSQRFILGPEVEACESELAAYSGCRHAVGVSSGSDALLMALMAEGIGPGDEVITSPFTFFASVGCIARVGARPVFADIDPATFNIRADRLEALVTERTRAIIPVHLYGQMADMVAIQRLADARGLVVVEDAAQSIGAERDGRRACSFGKYGCLSFFPSKNLSAAGDGGMVTTNDADACERLKCLRVHGSKPKYFHKVIGGNFRLDALQAALVRVKFKHLDAWTAARQANAARYDTLFAAAGLVTSGAVTPPAVVANRHVFNQYVIRVQHRDELALHLREAGIETAVYYPRPMHQQECFAYLGYKEGDFPEAERACREILAIPVAPHVTDKQAAYVVASIAAFY